MELIAVGKIIKPIGTRGEIKILPMTDNVERFTKLRSVWIGLDDISAERRDILRVRIEARQVIVSLGDIETLNAAEKLRNKYLFIPKEKIIKLHEGSYFVHDIIGCEVLTEGQGVVGVIKDVLSLPANDVWIVRNETKEMWIPAVKAIIQQIDTEKRRIVIHAIEGLLE